MNLISSARNLRRHLYPADGAVLSILIVASITAAVAGGKVRWLLLAHLGLLAGYLIFVILAGRFSAKPWVGWVRPLAAMMTVFALYCTIGLLGMSAMPYRSDPVLARIDTALFAGHNPTFFIQRWQTPGRVEFFAFFYALFIPYINFSLLLGSLGRPPLERDQFLTGWVFTYSICFLGCLFLPGQGPGGYFAGMYAVQLHGGYFFNTVVDTVAHSGGLMGIFPSLHVGSSVPTWSGRPAVVLESPALLLRAPSIEDPGERMRAQRLRYAEAEREFLAAVPEDLRFFFRELVRLTRTYTILDDLEHYQTTRINPIAHRAALALGQILVERGALREAADVFFLNKADVQAIVDDPSAGQASRLREKSLATRASYEQAMNTPAPWSPGKAGAAAASAPSGRTLSGLPGSPGRATGPCFRVRGPEDFGKFPGNSVLVARTTNPAWTPLFYTAAAIITESGGPLSHGAVTAREMGLPAVMSVRGIMNLVADGQMVTVDGSGGAVEIQEQSPTSASRVGP